MTAMHVMTSETELMVQNPETGGMPMHFEWGAVDSVQFTHERHNTLYHGVLMDEPTLGVLLKLLEHCLAKVNMKPATTPLVEDLRRQVGELLLRLHGDEPAEASA